MILNWAAAKALPVAYESNGNIRAKCPVHGGTDALALTVSRAGKPLWCCHAGCDSDEIRERLTALGVLVTDRTRPAHLPDGKLRWCKRFWLASAGVLGAPALAYLQGRGIPESVALAAARGGATLRWRAHEQEIVARVTDAADSGTGIHRTMIRQRERRAHGRLKHSAIRLFTAAPGATLAIAEGLETALAYRVLHPELVVWSLISATGVAGFTPPASVTSVIVATDFDGAGLFAAERLKGRLSKTDVKIDIPPTYRQDWNDVLMEARAK